MESLNRYDRATVGLWARSHGDLEGHPGQSLLAVVAVHAVLAGLRRCVHPKALLDRYEVDAAADFALINSLLRESPVGESLWQIRDSAFHLRWQELTRGLR